MPILIRGAETADVGTIRLELSGCDDPGLICDDFGTGRPDPIVAQGYITVKVGCGADLRKGRVDCGDAVDFKASREDGGLYLVFVNGCDDNVNDRRIRVDGLGPGDRICVRTRAGAAARIFFEDDIEPESTAIPLYFVTRRF